MATTAGTRWLVVIGVLVVALVGAGLWRRANLIDEQARARSDRVHTLSELRSVRRGLVTAQLAASAVEANTESTRHAATELVTFAEGVLRQVQAVEKSRDDAALAAFFANGQVGRLRDCLNGINRALNEVSVGDPNGVRTLETVRTACRAAGA